MDTPKIKTVEKYEPPYRLNKFPSDFPVSLGREIVYLLATRGESTRLEGSDWEEIFARVIGAQWKPSNVGLDDVVYEQTAWGAKTVKNKRPSEASRVRLISGRNSPVYSFGESKVANTDPAVLGQQVLSIWNERVAGVKKLFRNLRTIVLLKSDDLLEVAVFEFDTIMYDHIEYKWQWNERDNLEGISRSTGCHRFTWQPHGSQFTIIEDVPPNRLAMRIRKPPIIDRDTVLDSLKYDKTWIQVI